MQAIRGLEDRIDPLFQIDYHSFAKLILYPEGWQVETPATDAPMMKALVGDSATPAVPGFDPEVSAQLYTTNGDITGDALKNFKTQSFTVELDGGTGDPVGGTDDSDAAFGPGGFVFQDSESDIQDEFEKNLPFAMDLVKSATHPDDPTSHLGNVAPAMVPTKFTTSNGNPQTVEVNAKRSLGAITAHWTVDGGPEQTAATDEWQRPGGSRYGDQGVYYHKMRAQITGVQTGQDVTVWFTGGGKTSPSFTYHQASDTGADVLLMVAEDYLGNSGLSPKSDHPYYSGYYTAALEARGDQLRRVRRRNPDGDTRRRSGRAVAARRAVALQGRDLGDRRRRLRAQRRPAGRHGHAQAARRRDHQRPRLHERGRQAARRRPGRRCRAAGTSSSTTRSATTPRSASPTRRPATGRQTRLQGRRSRASSSPTTSSSTGWGRTRTVTVEIRRRRRCTRSRLSARRSSG